MYKHIVVNGDTLQSLAMRYTGDIANWVKIGEFNKLPTPDLIGTVFVYIPDFDDAGNVVVSAETVNFDTDLYLADDYAVNVGGDLGIVTGMDALVQDLQRRLNTRKGELLLHPEYGSKLETLIAIYGYDNLKRIELEILETVYQDDRVQEAKVLSISKQGKTLQIRCKIIAKHSVESSDAMLTYNPAA